MKSWLLSLICLSFITLASIAIAQRPETELGHAPHVIRPKLLDADIYLSNPMSGFHGEYDLSPAYAAPLPAPPLEEYEEIQWSCLENNGKYNFSFIDNILKTLPPGVKFAFRVKAFDASIRNNKCNIDNIVPSDLQTDQHGWRLPYDPSNLAKGYYFIPDWNEPIFLQRIAKLLSALGQRYDGDPRIAWVDIGVYGTWGEWHTQGLPNYIPDGIPYNKTNPYYIYNIDNAQPGTFAAKRFIIDAHIRGFPTTQLVMMTGNEHDGDALCYALKLPGEAAHIGLRRDSLGSGLGGWFNPFPEHYPGCDSPADVALILNRWQTAPFVAEPFGSKPARTFAMCSNGQTQEYCIDQEVIQYHVATVDDSDLGYRADGTDIPWKEVSPSNQKAFLWAGFHAGYRLAPIEIDVSQSLDAREHEKKTGRKLFFRTHWNNTGVTPAYNAWNVEFSLWTDGQSGAPKREVKRMMSHVDLRKILPTAKTPFVVGDAFALGDLPPGSYELRIKVADPKAYMKPMHLALRAQAEEDGGYPLEMIVVSK
jgi:hypothetical protein